MNFLFPHGKLLISMAVKYFFIALLTCVLIKINLGYKVFILQWVGGSFSRRFPIRSFHKLKKFPSCFFSNLKFIWNFKMERILLVRIIGIILFASECSVNEWNSNRGTHDFLLLNA